MGLAPAFPRSNNALADNYHIEKNVLVATVNKVSQPWCWFCDSEYYASLYPPNNYFPLTADEVGMTNYNNGLDGNYTLLPSSPYKNAGTDGKDIGADIAAVLYATRGAVSGNWDRAVSLSPGFPILRGLRRDRGGLRNLLHRRQLECGKQCELDHDYLRSELVPGMARSVIPFRPTGSHPPGRNPDDRGGDIPR